MEARILSECRGKNPSMITELVLDDTRSSTIEGLTDEFINLKTLSLNNVGLTRLKGFPRLPQLKKLEMSDNRISGGLELLKRSPNLTHLNLSGNKISELEALEPLREFVHLKSLDLYNNPVLNAAGYREKVFKLIPSLKYLDGADSENQAEESDGSGDEEDGDYDEEEEDNFIEEDDVGTDRLVRADDEEDEDEDDEDFEANEEDDDASLDEECDDEEDDQDEALAPGAQGDVANSDHESG